MITVTVDGMGSVREALAGFGEASINKTMATALTRTASQVRDEIKRQLPVIFDRPTPYTMNALYVKTASADDLSADVQFKDELAGSGTPATKYLLPEVEGGPRHTKRFERALQAIGALPEGWQVVPGAGAKLDAYGNVSTGQIIQILSQLRITMVAGFTRNMSFDARAQIRAQRKAGGRFFVIAPGAKGAAPGVYQREFMGRNITPVLMFVRAVSYRVRFPFADIAMREAQARMQGNLEDAMAERIAKSR